MSSVTSRIFCPYVNVFHHAAINTLRPRQDGRHFTDDIFKCIFLNENVWIPNKISLKFVPKGPINNIPAMVEIMAWRRPGDKPLSEPMVVTLPTHICVARPQWVKRSNRTLDLSKCSCHEDLCPSFSVLSTNPQYHQSTLLITHNSPVTDDDKQPFICPLRQTWLGKNMSIGSNVFHNVFPVTWHCLRYILLQ